MLKKLPFVTIITVNYNGKRYLKDCLNSLYNLNYPKNKLEVIIVDNCSTDDSIAFIKKNYPKVKLLFNDINNYCRANNLGIKQAKGKYIAIINNDTKVDEDWLIELIKVIESDKSLGAVGSKILFMDGRIESVGHQELPNFYWLDKGCEEKDYSQYDELEEVKSLCGCAVLYRKSALKDVNYFDEDFNMYIEDIDISIRLKRNKWKLFYVPKSSVYHIHHGTAQEDLSLFYTERNRLLLVAKYYPEKLSNALLGRGYFTAQKDIKAQAGLYKILVDLVLKLIKHHKIGMVKNILSELFEELKRVSNFENSILADKIEHLLKSIESQQELIKNKDNYINNLRLEVGKKDQELKEKDQLFNLELTKRDQAINEKDNYINNLRLEVGKKDQELKDIYNSTAFQFIVNPLWKFIWKIKQTAKSIKTFKFPSGKFIIPQGVNNTKNSDGKINIIDRGICTIISKNYLAYARVLAESFLKYNKGEVFILLTDDIDGYFDPNKEKFKLIKIDAIKDRIKDFEKFCFQYNSKELNTAVKPFFLEYLFEKYQLQKLLFFDPDILITNNLDYLFKLLEKFSVVLIPHITRPFRDNHKPTEIEILKSGVYNLGFIGLSNKNSTKLLLEWWRERLNHFCKIDIEEGLFVDQKWIDLIPGFFDDVFILKDESYNIAYWNLHYRKVYMDGSSILVNGKPAHFLHFSGFNIEDIDSISRHQNRFKLKDLSDMRPVFELYKNKLLSNGYNDSKNWPCVFNYFNNGVKIPDCARKMFWEINNRDNKKFDNPFNNSGKNSYFNWLNENVDSKNPNVTRLMFEIYKIRSDVQSVYPNIFDSDRRAFVEWFSKSAKREYDIDNVFLDSLLTNHLKGKKTFRIGIKLKIMNKTRDVLKIFLKKIFGNNLRMIIKLRMLEMQIYKKIMHISNIFTKKTDYANQETDKKGINVWGYLTAELGVGEAARGHIRCLESKGINFSLININPTYSRQFDLSFSDFSLDNPYHINLIYVNADMFSRLYIEKGRNYFNGKYNIGFWTWELPDFPNVWLDNFRYCDEIWAPSSFVLTSIAKKTPIPALKIPYAVTVDKLKNVDRSYFGLSDNDFIFLFVFDFLSYFERKNPLAIIKAFKKAFSINENVKLVIKCCNSSFDPPSIKNMRGASKKLNIDIIDKYFYKDEVNALMYLCDSYISLHRSEGFGLTLAEAMSSGKPVIATGFSGNTDFMNINNSYLVRYKLVQIERDVGPYKKGSFWAEPDIEHAAELMRYVYDNREASKKIGEIASADIRRSLNYSVIGNEIKNRIDYIYQRNFK